MKIQNSLTLFAFIAILINTSCDKITYPNVIITELDTNYYPGNFIDYDFPTFEANTNTERNALIEDYTGHKCTFCPGAAEIAKGIEEANPGRAFTATIHCGPSSSGITDFQSTGFVDGVDFTYDFTNPQGLEMGSYFYGAAVGFNSNPKGNVNRFQEESGAYFISPSRWSSTTDSVFNTTLPINIQAKSNYFESTRAAYIHVESELMTDLTGKYNIVGYILQNEIIAPQKGVDGVDLNYKHHNVHLGNFYDETWGRSIISESEPAGTKIQTNFSYKLPDGLSKEDIHFLIFVYNRETFEVMQVIKHTL